MFYKSLGRLLMFDLGEDEERFYSFMAPITSKLYQLFYDTRQYNTINLYLLTNCRPI